MCLHHRKTKPFRPAIFGRFMQICFILLPSATLIWGSLFRQDCLYFIDKYFGLCYLRVATLAPFRLQCFDLFNEEYNCQMVEVRGRRAEDKGRRCLKSEFGMGNAEGEMSGGEPCAWCIEQTQSKFKLV